MNNTSEWAIEIPSGLKTTEFWAAVLTAGLVFLTKVLHLNIAAEDYWSMVGPIMVYVGGRSAVKGLAYLNANPVSSSSNTPTVINQPRVEL